MAKMKPSSLKAYDCDDTDGLVEKHKISAITHGYMAARYFGVSIPDPKKVSVSELDLTLNCNEFCIRFTFDASIQENDDIEVFMDSLDAKEKVKKPKTVSNGRYSIPLFKGIVNEKAPDTFLFCKAIEKVDDGPDFPTVIFKAVKNGNIVYRGNLSSQFPLHGKKKA